MPKWPHLSTHRTPIVVFSEARSGADSWFDLLRAINLAAPNEVSVLHLDDPFANDFGSTSSTSIFRSGDEVAMRRILEPMASSCFLPGTEKHSIDDLLIDLSMIKTGNESINDNGVKSIPDWTTKKIIHRREDPSAVLDYVARIPSISKQAFFSFQVFRHHLSQGLNMSLANFIYLFQAQHPGTKFVVIRSVDRRILQTNERRKTQTASGNVWTSVRATEKSAINMAKLSVEDGNEEALVMDVRQQNYTEVQNALIGAGANFEVFEYETIVEDKESIIKRLVAFLDVPMPNINMDEAIKKVQSMKQNHVSINNY